jgi:hypothetical protein
MLVYLSELWEIPMCLSLHTLSLLLGLGRIVLIFYVMLSLLSLGLTIRIG